MRSEPVPELDIIRVLEYLGVDIPVHIKTHGWTPIHCPVHGGGSGSLNQSANKFHCFGGCDFGNNHNGGDSYDLLNVMEGMSLAEAKELGEQQGWVVDGVGRGGGLAKKPRNTKRPDRTQRGRKPGRM